MPESGSRGDHAWYEPVQIEKEKVLTKPSQNLCMTFRQIYEKHMKSVHLTTVPGDSQCILMYSNDSGHMFHTWETKSWTR